MTDRFESILDECISALQAGISIDEILAEVPDYADELRPLLYAASVLADPKPDLAPEETKYALRDQYLKYAAELPALSTPSFGEKTQAIWHVIRRRLTRQAVVNDLITITVTISLTVLMALLILSYLAVDALPGDFLYNVKRATEKVQLALTFTETQRGELEHSFDRRRLQEVEQLIEQNRVAVVEFKGILETKGENLWVVEGHTIFIPPDIAGKVSIREGDLIEVIGLLRTNNVVVADTIRRVEFELPR
jgi:hypothetical protein